jgi:hypothetical protein
VDLEEMPSLSWSTIRIYYAGDRNEDHQQAFEKLSRALGYTGIPVPATSFSTNNWASPYSSAASRPLPTVHQPTRSSHSRLVIPVVAASILIIFFLSFILSASLLSKFRSTPTPTPNARATETAQRASTAFANVKATGTATTRANATATAVSLDTVLYNTDTRKTPYLTSLDAQDDNSQWQHDSECVLKPDSTYDVKSTLDGHYKVCMASSNMSLTNFAYQVTMQIISGDAGGLIFRSDGAQQYYRFSLNSNGRYALLVCQSSICSDTNTKISNGLPLVAGNLKNVGQVNTLVVQTTTLSVIATDNTIYLYVNKIFLNEVKDSTISQGGEIGVFAASENQHTEVAFSEVKVWKLPD